MLRRVTGDQLTARAATRRMPKKPAEITSAFGQKILAVTE